MSDHDEELVWDLDDNGGPGREQYNSGDDSEENPEVFDAELDYHIILENLCKAWMDAELEHTVSKSASNHF